MRATGVPPYAHWQRRLLALCLSAFAGCASPRLGPSVPVPARFQSVPVFNRESAPGISDIRWWHQFQNPTLDRLIEEAAANNRDVRGALARVELAHAQLRAATAGLLPNIAAVGSNEKDTNGYSPAIRQQAIPDIDASQAGAQVSWQIDLFGQARAARNAAKADTLAAEDTRRGAVLSAISETAEQYFVLLGAQEQRQIVGDLIHTERDTLRLTERRRTRGSASDFDLDRARAELADTEALLPDLDTLVITTRNRIAVLTGQVPGHWDELLSQTPVALVVPAEPVAEPAELLRRRPDLMAADASLKAAGFRQDEARAQQFPQLLVSALIGSQWSELNGLDIGRARFTNAASALTLPLFAGGRIHAAIRAADATQREALARYEQTLLRALEDVDGALTSYGSSARRGTFLQMSIANRTAALSKAQSLYKAGEIDLLQLLDVERGLLASRLAGSVNQTAQLTDAVQSYRALGGGWETFEKNTASSVAAIEHTNAAR
jgi:outer membrane protein, multidrug efflux system